MDPSKALESLQSTTGPWGLLSQEVTANKPGFEKEPLEDQGLWPAAQPSGAWQDSSVQEQQGGRSGSLSVGGSEDRLLPGPSASRPTHTHPRLASVLSPGHSGPEHQAFCQLGLSSRNLKYEPGILAFLSLSGTPTSDASLLFQRRKQHFQLGENVPSHPGRGEGSQRPFSQRCQAAAASIFSCVTCCVLFPQHNNQGQAPPDPMPQQEARGQADPAGWLWAKLLGQGSRVASDPPALVVP